MTTWVGCKNCTDFWKGKVGDPCIECGSLAVATPLFPAVKKEYPDEWFLLMHQDRLLAAILRRKIKQATEHMNRLMYTGRQLPAGAFERAREQWTDDLFRITVSVYRATKDLRRIVA